MHRTAPFWNRSGEANTSGHPAGFATAGSRHTLPPFLDHFLESDVSDSLLTRGWGVLSLLGVMVVASFLISAFNAGAPLREEAPTEPVVTVEASTSPSTPSEAPAERNSKTAASRQAKSIHDFPRTVTAGDDIKITMDDGIVNVRKGEKIELLGRTENGYDARFETYSFVVFDRDFVEER